MAITNKKVSPEEIKKDAEERFDKYLIDVKKAGKKWSIDLSARMELVEAKDLKQNVATAVLDFKDTKYDKKETKSQK